MEVQFHFVASAGSPAPATFPNDLIRGDESRDLHYDKNFFFFFFFFPLVTIYLPFVSGFGSHGIIGEGRQTR